MFHTYTEVLDHQINREATVAAREYTPASMRPRHLRGKTEQRILINGRYYRKDAEAIATRKLVFGTATSRDFGQAVAIGEALARAKQALGLSIQPNQPWLAQ